MNVKYYGCGEPGVPSYFVPDASILPLGCAALANGFPDRAMPLYWSVPCLQ